MERKQRTIKTSQSCEGVGLPTDLKQKLHFIRLLKIMEFDLLDQIYLVVQKLKQILTMLLIFQEELLSKKMMLEFTLLNML